MVYQFYTTGNKLLKIQCLKRTKLLSHSFCRSEVWTWHCWIIFSWSYWAEIKASVRLHLIWGLRFSSKIMVVGRIQFLEVVGLRSCFLAAILFHLIGDFLRFFPSAPFYLQARNGISKLPYALNVLLPLLQPVRKTLPLKGSCDQLRPTRTISLLINSKSADQ